MSQQASILIIDDEPQIRKFLRISLGSQGYRVSESGDGQDGLASAALNKPDLVVLDLGLPDMDGQTVLRELREWSQVPVIVLSVRSSETEKVMALDGGAVQGVLLSNAILARSMPGPTGILSRAYLNCKRETETTNLICHAIGR